VLVMRDIDGFDYQQMADILGLRAGNVEEPVVSGRGLALRDELKSYFGMKG